MSTQLIDEVVNCVESSTMNWEEISKKPLVLHKVLRIFHTVMKQLFDHSLRHFSVSWHASTDSAVSLTTLKDLAYYLM